jgi:catechol 2,3-dioxygenase-like lactoylglutathione lyase family enzyme
MPRNELGVFTRSANVPVMKVPFTLGTVGHFGLAVASPSRSAEWFKRALGLSLEFEFEEGVAVGNENVTIALFKGKPSPETIGHMSFHLPSMAKLRRALEHLKRAGVEIEDPGDEIGPEAPGSPNMGLWFHDPDGYRWELSVLGAQKRPRRKRPAKAAARAAQRSRSRARS